MVYWRARCVQHSGCDLLIDLQKRDVPRKWRGAQTLVRDAVASERTCARVRLSLSELTPESSSSVQPPRSTPNGLLGLHSVCVRVERGVETDFNAYLRERCVDCKVGQDMVELTGLRYVQATT